MGTGGVVAGMCWRATMHGADEAVAVTHEMSHSGPRGDIGRRRHGVAFLVPVSPLGAQSVICCRIDLY